MKVLDLNLKYLSFMGIDADDTSYAIKCRYFFIFLGAVYSLGVGSIANIIVNLIEGEASVPALISVYAATTCTVSFITYARKAKTIKFLCKEFQMTADRAKGIDAYQLYDEAERRGHFLTKYLVAYILTETVLAAPLVMLIADVYNVCVTKDYENGWFWPYIAELGVDKSTVFGFLLQFLATSHGTLVYNIVLSITITFFISSCYFLRASCAEVAHLFGEIDRMCTGRDIKTIASKIEKKLQCAILLHVKLTELFYFVEEIANGMMFTQLLGNVVLLSASLYSFEEIISSIGFEIFINLHCLFCGISLSFIICYHATAVTYAMLAVGDELYSSYWYKYPVEYRKYLVLMMARSQQTAVFTGFKILTVQLETFEKLTRTAFSYYVMFRNLAQR